MAPRHIQGGWVLSSRLGFWLPYLLWGMLCWHVMQFYVACDCCCGCVGSKGSFCLYRLLTLTHFGRSWVKSMGRWLPLRDSLSGDKGVGWLVLQIKFRPLIACAVKMCYGRSHRLQFWLLPSWDALVLRAGGHGESCPRICATSLHFPVVFWIPQGLSSERTGILVTNQHGQ